MCVRERVNEREKKTKVFVCEREREREEGVYQGVCVRERERERRSTYACWSAQMWWSEVWMCSLERHVLLHPCETNTQGCRHLLNIFVVSS